jgi:phage-related minor tail protein
LRELNKLLNAGAINTETYNRAVANLNQRLAEEGNSAQAGFARGIRQVKEEVNDLGSLTEDLVVNSFSKLEDTLVSAFTTGKFEAKEFFNAILADLARLAIRAAIIRPLFNFFGGFGFEQGGVPALQGFAQGGVVNQPTFFPMAKGDVGVMSEFGQDEAIMPLQRTSDGDLGVRARLDNIGKQNQSVTIAPNLNITIEASGSVISSVDDFKGEIAEATGSFVTESIVNELRQGGFLERG